MTAYFYAWRATKGTKWHVFDSSRRGGACGASLDIRENRKAVPLADVAVELRCRRGGCARHWPPPAAAPTGQTDPPEPASEVPALPSKPCSHCRRDHHRTCNGYASSRRSPDDEWTYIPCSCAESAHRGWSARTG